MNATQMRDRDFQAPLVDPTTYPSPFKKKKKMFKQKEKVTLDGVPFILLVVGPSLGLESVLQIQIYL